MNFEKFYSVLPKSYRDITEFKESKDGFVKGKISKPHPCLVNNGANHDTSMIWMIFNEQKNCFIVGCLNKLCKGKTLKLPVKQSDEPKKPKIAGLKFSIISTPTAENPEVNEEQETEQEHSSEQESRQESEQESENETEQETEQKSEQKSEQEQDLKSTATALTSRGFVVLPYSRPLKFPSFKGWQTTTTTPLEYYDKGNVCGHGILCGKVSNLTVVDIDVADRGIEVWNLILKQFDPHSTIKLTVSTPSGGLHYYFNYVDSTYSRSKLKLVRQDGTEEIIGIDVKTEKGQVVAPPTPYPGFLLDGGNMVPIDSKKQQFVGVPYKFRVPIDKLRQKCPEWLVTILKSRTIYLLADGSVSISCPNATLQPLKSLQPKTSDEKQVNSPPHNQKLTFDQIKEIYMSIDSVHATKYDDWCSCLWALERWREDNKENEKQVEQLAFEFSKRTTSANCSSIDYIVSKLKQANTATSSAVTLGTVIHWLKTESPEVYSKHFNKNHVAVPLTNTFDRTDKYRWVDFERHYSSTVFDDFNQMLAALKIDLPRVLVKVSVEKGIFVKKDNNSNKLFTLVDTIIGNNNLIIKYKEQKTSATSAVTKKMRLNDIFNEFRSDFPVFENMVCKPKLSDVGADEFNIWSGFKATELPMFDEKLIAPIKQLIFEVWASKNQEVYDYIIKWLSFLVCEPWHPAEVALLLISGQGTGKNTLIDFISEFVIGDHVVMNSSGISSVVQKHNLLLSGKRLNIINEMASTRDEFRSNFDKMKALISDRKITVEPKNVNSFEIENIGCWIMISNHRDAVIIEEKDRRYCCIDVWEGRMKDFDYFKQLRNTSFNQTVGDHFFTFLKYVCATKIDVLKFPVTKLKLEMMEISKPNYIRFLESVKEDLSVTTTHDGSPFFDTFGNTYNNRFLHNGDAIRADSFYLRYREWCSKTGEQSILTNTKFGTMIKKYISSKKTKTGICYCLSSINI